MKFQPDRLISIRKSLGINKAEAARKLNMSAMGYGRYERGEREPSFQTVSFIANVFHTTTDFLYGISDTMDCESITVRSTDDPELFYLIKMIKDDNAQVKRIYAYYKKLSSLGDKS